MRKFGIGVYFSGPKASLTPVLVVGIGATASVSATTVGETTSAVLPQEVMTNNKTKNIYFINLLKTFKMKAEVFYPIIFKRAN